MSDLGNKAIMAEKISQEMICVRLLDSNTPPLLIG